MAHVARTCQSVQGTQRFPWSAALAEPPGVTLGPHRPNASRAFWIKNRRFLGPTPSTGEVPRPNPTLKGYLPHHPRRPRSLPSLVFADLSCTRRPVWTGERKTGRGRTGARGPVICARGCARGSWDPRRRNRCKPSRYPAERSGTSKRLSLCGSSWRC